MTTQERYNQLIEIGDFDGAASLTQTTPGVSQMYIASVDPALNVPVTVTSIDELRNRFQSIVNYPERQVVLQTNEAGMRVFQEALREEAESWAENTLNSPEMTRLADEMRADEGRLMWAPLVRVGDSLVEMPVPGNADNENSPNIKGGPQVQVVTDAKQAVEWMLNK